MANNVSSVSVPMRNAVHGRLLSKDEMAELDRRQRIIDAYSRAAEQGQPPPVLDRNGRPVTVMTARTTPDRTPERAAMYDPTLNQPRDMTLVDFLQVGRDLRKGDYAKALNSSLAALVLLGGMAPGGGNGGTKPGQLQAAAPSKIIEVPALRAPRALWEQYGKIYPSVAADALSRGFQTYRRTHGYELPFQTGLGRSVIHEPESMARVWESLAQGFEKLSGTGESAPGKITRLSGVYDINALGANHDDVGRTNMKKWMDIWRETGYLPVSSIYGTGETVQPVVQPSGKTLKVPVPGTVNPWSMKSHFTGAVPVERQDGRYVDVARNYSTGAIADLVNMNAHTLGTTFQLISEPAFLNTVLQPVIRESQTTTPVGPVLGGGHVLRGTKVFQPGEVVRRPVSGWSSPRWDAKGGNARKSVRAAEEGGDAEGLETAVSETPVSRGGPVPEGYRGPRIVINPTTFHNKKDALCVAFNEAFRVVMEDMGFDPVAEPTDRQRKFFSDTAYADDETQLRRTILARICTFDTSVKDPTDEQLQEAVEFLESVMEAGYPQNEWEQSAVQRIHDVVERAVGAPRAEGTGGEEPASPSAPGGEGAVQAAEGGGETQESDDNPFYNKDGSFKPVEGYPKLAEGFSYRQIPKTEHTDAYIQIQNESEKKEVGNVIYVAPEHTDSTWANYSLIPDDTKAMSNISFGGKYLTQDEWKKRNWEALTVSELPNFRPGKATILITNGVINDYDNNNEIKPYDVSIYSKDTPLPWAAPSPVPDYDFVTDAVTTRGSEKWWDEQFGPKQQVGPTVEAAKQLQQAAPAQPQQPQPQPWKPATAEQKPYQKTATGAPNQYSQLSREDRNRARMYRAHHMSGADANRMAGVTYSGIYTTNAGLNGALARPDKYTGKTPTQQRSTAMVPAARPVASTWDDFELANRRRRRMWGDVD